MMLQSDPWIQVLLAFIVTIISAILAYKFLHYKRERENVTHAPSIYDENKTPTPSPNNDIVEIKERTEMDFNAENADKDKGIDEKYTQHIQSNVKRAKARVTQEAISKSMTDEQKEEEKNIRTRQLESIYKLMSEQGDRFGMNSMDDIHQQLKLYT